MTRFCVLKWILIVMSLCSTVVTDVGARVDREQTRSTVEIAFDSGAPYYQPHVAVVERGTVVRWTNPTASPHSIRHDGCAGDGPCAFRSLAVAPDESFVIAPLPTGTYPYHCELHPIMRGVLVVTDMPGPVPDEIAGIKSTP